VDKKSRVAVTSRSFSRNLVLRKLLTDKYKNVTFNDAGVSLNGQELIDFLQGHDKAITALETINDSVLSQLPELKVIGKYGVGLDMIDMAAMRKYNIAFGWTGGVNCRSVSELVIAFAISMLRHIPQSQAEVLDGVWRQHVGGLLSNRTVGIIGCGFVGKDLVKLLRPFGVRILVYDTVNYSDFYLSNNIESLTLNELLIESDIVSVHVPLDESTRNMINAEQLTLMKSNAILINIARGGIVNERALKNALVNKQIAAAAFDVFVQEPPEDMSLIKLPNFLVTPHIGGSSEEVILAMGKAAIDGLINNQVVQC
jgi:phosphoglycerate dehydrogenase-like enzyme